MSSHTHALTNALVLRDLTTKELVTPELFVQLPERDYMDHETGKMIPDHVLHGRIVWRGKVWLVFSSLKDPVSAIYRYELVQSHRPSILDDSEHEARRLARVIEAIRVRDGRVNDLPVKLTVCGQALYCRMYTHDCMAVRYPLLGVDANGMPGKSKRTDIQAWIKSQGFAPGITEPEVLCAAQCVLETAEKRLGEWLVARAALTSFTQVFLAPWTGGQ